jgi:hypothetical protein
MSLALRPTLGSTSFSKPLQMKFQSLSHFTFKLMVCSQVSFVPRQRFISIGFSECTRIWADDDDYKEKAASVSLSPSKKNTSLAHIEIAPDNTVSYSLNTSLYDNSTIFHNFTLMDLISEALNNDNTSSPILASVLSKRDGERCYIAPQLGRASTANRPFQARFAMHIGISTILNRVYVADFKATVIKFEIEALVDTGGTLRFESQLDRTMLVSSVDVSLV